MPAIRPFTAALATLGLAFGLACTGYAEGERASFGECPRGEVCNDDTPGGLIFWGMNFWDEPGNRLGPVIVGGRFELAFTTADADLDAWHVETTGVLEATPIEGRPHAVLVHGRQSGDGMVRVVDDRGQLYDRLPLEAVEVDDVEIGNVTDPDRDVLYGGCEEMIGVRLVASAGGQRLRAFDALVRVEAEGGVRPDVGIWDCFRYDVPIAGGSVTFEITSGGRTFQRTVDVVPIDDPANCPELPQD